MAQDDTQILADNSGDSADDRESHVDAPDNSSSTQSSPPAEDSASTDTDNSGDSEGGRHLGHLIGDGIIRVARSERTAGLVATAEDALWQLRRVTKIGKGSLRSTYIVGYRGYVANGHAYARVRVTEEPVIPKPAAILSDSELIRSNLRRFAAFPFPGVDVKLKLAGSEDLMETDRHGYAAGNVSVGELVPGWHDYAVETEPENDDEEPARARGRVLVPDPTAKVWVVSDIDDTVLQTGLADGLTSIMTTLLGQAHTRSVVPGMASLYRALEAGLPGDGRSAFFYLSTGPWSLYSMLTEFMKVRGFPDGPLFLTDWGPQERYITRSGVEHKRKALRRLATHYPDRKFVLIGDSGQKDAFTYAEFAREFPSSVAAIIIIDVGLETKCEKVSAHGELVVAEGIPFYYVVDSREAAVILADMELITAEAVESVARAYERS